MVHLLPTIPAVSNHNVPAGGTARGFSLIEMMLVVCVISILAAMVIPQIGAVRPQFQGDGVMRVVMGELNAAREMAIAQRRAMRLGFVGTNRLQIVREEIGGQTTVVRDVYFEAGVHYGLAAGAGDTPDGYGNSSATYFNGAAQVKFNTEGSLVDEANAPVNGTVFLMIPNQPLSFRAVTIQGAIGRVRGFKWIGTQWRRA
jgi:prepilin-type N-terminal cleavage/methylation domain-containing protein